MASAIVESEIVTSPTLKETNAERILPRKSPNS